MDVNTVTHATPAAATSFLELLGLTPANASLAVAVLIAVGIVVAVVRRGSRNAGGWSPRAEATTVRDVESVLRELDRVSRQIHGRLDAKIATLEALLCDADQRVDQLSRLARASGDETTLDVTLDCEPPTPDDDEPVDAPHAEVYRLADDGQTPPEIARRLGRTAGEIELILALRRARRPASPSAVAPRG